MQLLERRAMIAYYSQYFLRDLGTSLSHLQVLWLARCGLTELEGISALSSLKVTPIIKVKGLQTKLFELFFLEGTVKGISFSNVKVCLSY